MKITIPLVSLSWHGGVRVLVQLANHLNAAGHDVELLVARRYVTGYYVVSPGVSLRHVGIHTGIKALDYFAFLLLLPFVVRRRSLIVANFFLTYYPAIFAAWLKDGRHIYLVQDIESKYTGVLGRLLNAVCRHTYRDKNMITVNRYLHERLRDEFKAGSDSVDIGPADIFYDQARTDRQDSSYDMAFFARREPWKGLDRFYELLDRHEMPWRLICISQDQELITELRKRGLECVCPVDDAELIRVIDSSRTLLFTSHDEGFGLPPLEAMARGVPLVLYPCRGSDVYVVHEQNAIYVRNVEESHQRISHLLSNADLHQRLSTAGRQTAERFRMSAALAVIRSFIEERPPPVYGLDHGNG